METEAAHGVTGQRPHSGRSSAPGNQEPSSCCVPLPYRNGRKLILSPHSGGNGRFNQQEWLSVFEQGCLQSVERLPSTRAPGGTRSGRNRLTPKPAPPSIPVPTHFLLPHVSQLPTHTLPSSLHRRGESPAHSQAWFFLCSLFSAKRDE